MYLGSTTSTLPGWKKEMSINERIANVTPLKDGLMAIDFQGHFFQKMFGSNVWLPTFTSFEDQLVRSVFEAHDGSFFIGCGNGLFKSSDNGQTWKHVYKHGWVIEMVESDGVIIAPINKAYCARLTAAKTGMW
ncbi:MAG: hypothetical protein IPO92_22875 [Saprospiraceae bacterium]|nr:hypothetical protein [Saprospiraceae bacterium]